MGWFEGVEEDWMAEDDWWSEHYINYIELRSFCLINNPASIDQFPSACRLLFSKITNLSGKVNMMQYRLSKHESTEQILIFLVHSLELLIAFVGEELMDETEGWPYLLTAHLELWSQLHLWNLLQISNSNHIKDDTPSQEGWSDHAERILHEGQIQQIPAKLGIVLPDASWLHVLLKVPTTCDCFYFKAESQ